MICLCWNFTIGNGKLVYKREEVIILRNTLKEQAIPDWRERLESYKPQTSQEQQDFFVILSEIQKDGEAVLFREREQGHITCSGFVMTPELDAFLMVYHNIYQSFSWTGGHADGSTDFLGTAIREAKEETGVQNPFPLTGAILSVDILPVAAHERHGKSVAAYTHYNITYGLIANRKETLCIQPDENSAVQWVAVEELEKYVTESHMLPIYQKIMERMCMWKTTQTLKLLQLALPILTWYPTHARDLPWRQTKDPYRVWLSEIMLQQTRVEAVKNYYQRFLTVFPDVRALANAEQDLVNKYWEGLGYYSRAKNLRKAAQIISTKYDGVFPKTLEEIAKLPGIGSYTAGAICSICYGTATPAVDGNVMRVVARVTDCFCEINRSAMKAAVISGLEKVYQQNSNECDMLTQGLMELGATVCLPNGKPLCDKCPISRACLGLAFQDVERLPIRVEKKKRRKEQYTVFLLCCDEKYAIRKRKDTGLLAGLWEYLNVSGICTAEEAITQAAAWQCQPIDFVRTVEKKHIFTHIEWEMVGVTIRCGRQDEHFVWKTESEIQQDYFLPTAFRQFMDLK